MTTPALPLRQRIFRAVARFDVTHPWLVLMLSAILAALCVMYTKARLQFQTGQDDLISANNRDSRDYLNYTKEFPDLDGLIVAVRTAPDRTRAEHFTDALAARLKADHVNVKSVFYRVDRGMMGSGALLYLSLDDLQQLDARLTASIPLIQAYGADPALATLFAVVNAQLDRAAAGLRRGADAQRAGTNPSANLAMLGKGAAINPSANLAMLDAVLAGMLADPASNPPSPWRALNPQSAPGGAEHDGYLVSDNGKYLLIDIAPGDGVANGPDPVAVIQADLDAVRAQMPGVAAGMTGGPALAYAEQSTTQHDMMLASVLAISSNIALIVIPFRGLVEPLFAIIALLTGVAWSFGFTTLAVGHLNLLSAVFTSVLAGIGINFPIHLMARYDEARRNGAAMPAAVDLAVVNTGTGVFASACIMALAFLMPMFTDFKGIAELGLVSAAGLFMCLLSAMLVFPALIALRDRRRPPPVRPTLSLAPRRSTLEKLFARPGLIVGISVAATAGALFLIRDVHFDQNVLKLQASGAEAVRYENLLLRDSGRSSWFAVALAPTAAAADRKAAAFRKLPEVAGVQTLTTYIPTHQAQKLALLAALGRRLAPVSIRATPSANDGALARELNGLAARLNAMRQADPAGGVLKTAALAEDAIARLKRQPGAFNAYQSAIAASLGAEIDGLKAQITPSPITQTNLPRILRERFIGTGGSYLVQVYPKGQIWDDAPLKRFADAVRTVDRDTTGPPLQTYNLATVMRQGYERAALLALIAVFIFVYADFRSLRDTLLATVPLLFGGAWLLEVMPLLGWEFNLANLFAVPIIIGMGVDNGVNMLYRWREERDKSSLILTRAVGKSVTICSLTTIAAFAALIPATHRGISSLGWVLSVGVSLILAATLIVLPALFELLGGRLAHTHEAGSPAAGADGLIGPALIPEVVSPEPPTNAPSDPAGRRTGTHDL